MQEPESEESEEKPKKPELIVALDLPTYDEAMIFVDALGETVSWFKVGMELFTAEGDRIVRALKHRQYKLMLDLKFMDIDETVARAVRAAANLGVDMLTIHALGGPAMIHAAKEAAGKKVKILAVTVLTSLDESDLVEIGYGPTPHKTLVHDLALRLFRLADKCGADGVVCSALEVEALKANTTRKLLYVTPGIRLAGNEAGGQKRIATPAVARDAGASHIVVGRPIRDAKDRAAVVRAITAELQV